MWQSPYFSATTHRTSNSTEATGASLVLSLGWTSQFGGNTHSFGWNIWIDGGNCFGGNTQLIGGIPVHLNPNERFSYLVRNSCFRPVKSGQGVLICAPDCCNVSDDQKQIQLGLNALDMAHLSNVKWPNYYYCYMYIKIYTITIYIL